MIEPNPDRATMRAMFRDYHETRDLATRDALVAAHLRLALHLARQFANRGVSTDDLEQVASLGLIHAIDRFDPDRGLEFSTFATPTIQGELKRYFRDKGWAVRVPRRVQELHLRLNTLVPSLNQRYGRSPTITELASAARATHEEILEAMEASQAYRPLSIAPDPDGTQDPGQAVLAAEDPALFAAEDRLEVEQLLATLPPRDQLLMRLRYFEDMTQLQIADRLGVSQMHVSRSLARCLERLRATERASDA